MLSLKTRYVVKMINELDDTIKIIFNKIEFGEPNTNKLRTKSRHLL